VELGDFPDRLNRLGKALLKEAHRLAETQKNSNQLQLFSK
jgi:hypothetical protein